MRLLIFLFALIGFARPALAAEIPLFDGKSLDGWEGDAKWWRVEDGTITGGSLSEKVDRNHFLATKKSYQNFDLRLQIKITGTEGFINSGVQIRSVRVPNNTEMSGYQVDAGDGWWGKIYDESRRNKVIAQAKDLKAVNAAVKKNDWNEYRIRADGPRIQSWINGVPALDYTEADPNIAQNGLIGIQVHGGGKALVQVKQISIEELPATPDAPTWDKIGRPGTKKPGGAKTSPAMKEGNVPAAGPRTAQEQLATFTLPEGLEMELVAAEIPEEGIGKFVAVYFDQKGAMWTMTALEYPVDGNENKATADALYASKAKDKILVYDRDPNSTTGFAQKPRVFADGLAIPLGILPYKDGCYVQHGPDIVFLRDTDNDGKADKREVILTGFGVQDSHLFPHQFTRAPGGWIWFAQGAFNYSKVRRPGEPPEKAIQFDQTRMAKFRPDGSEFTITSQGPCNIWGLVINAEGEAFIQEANDYGYPVMPFHEFANYPGCSDRQFKSYAPEFPGTAPHFKMGGTGLSGLALTDKDGIYPEAWRDMMLVANPITNRVQAIKMHRDGPYWKLDPPKDFVTTTDPWFRPVALTLAPDGCVYIVDWYNKIISHNEVPRAHPDRDKVRGRIWRVKPKGKALLEVLDFTKLSTEQLLARLGSASVARGQLAWQALADRDRNEGLWQQLAAIANDTYEPAARRIQALWSMRENGGSERVVPSFTASSNRNLRREITDASAELWSDADALQQILRPLINDPDPEVRAAALRNAGRILDSSTRLLANSATWVTILSRDSRQRPATSAEADQRRSEWRQIIAECIELLASAAKEPLAEPTASSTRDGKPQKVREAYDRAFERYLVRMFLERHPEAVAKFLDSEEGKKLPVEAQLLAALSLEPKTSARRVAAILPQLKRSPEKEEILRLVQFLDQPGVGDAIRKTFFNPATAATVLNTMLELRDRLDPAKVHPLLIEAIGTLLASGKPEDLETGIKLAGAFKVSAAESSLASLVEKGIPEQHDNTGNKGRTYLVTSGPVLPALKALREMGSNRLDLFERIAGLAENPDARTEALAALATSKDPDAAPRVLKLYPSLSPTERRSAVEKLTTTKAGSAAVVAAITSGTIAITDVGPATLDRLVAVLGDKDPALNQLVESLGTLFRPVLDLDGSDTASADTTLTIDGPATVEAWVKLAPGITNADGILCAPGKLDLNFHDSRFRVWAGAGLHDVAVAKKKMIPEMWTHVAATRDTAGLWKIYLDGELDAIGTKPAPQKIENPRIAFTNAAGGTKGQLAGLRIWNRERAPDEIRADFDRGLLPVWSLAFDTSHSHNWGKLNPGAKLTKTSDLPPTLTPEAAAKLDAEFSKYRALAEQPGDIDRGKVVAAICAACHLMGTTGGQIGPNLSGVGAMGIEAILRNILTPNAAMESAYRIYRVEQKDGTVLDAYFVSEDKDAVIIRLPGAADQRIPKSNIRATTFLRRSLMPENLLEGMSPQQVSDLFAYLKSLK